MSTIWGSIHLFSAKNSRMVDDGSITFGQVLPVALLIAPLLSLVVAVFQLHRDASFKPLGGGHGLDESHVRPADVHSEFEQSAPSAVREPQPLWLTRSYYGESWMMPTIAMAVGQILYLTISIFQLLASNVSAARTLASMLLWTFIVQPASCYFVILLGLAVGTHVTHQRSRCHLPPKCLSFVYWLFSVIIFVSYSMFLVWFRPGTKRYIGDPINGNSTFLVIHLPIAGGIVFLYCIICCLTIRSPVDCDEEQIEMDRC